MDFVLVGRVVNTHGIKGEIRIKSNFPYKDRIFQLNHKIYIGKEKKEEVITGYRKHKEFDMITLENYHNINEVLPFLKQDVYVSKTDLHLSNHEYLDDDLIGLEIYENDQYLGKIIEVFAPSPYQKVIRFTFNGKNYLIPYVQSFVKSIDLLAKKMILYSIEGVIECE